MKPPEHSRDPVSRLVNELKEDTPPELDWQRMEASLLRRIQEPLAPARATRAWPRWSLAIAAGALAVIGARELILKQPVARLEASAVRWQAGGRVTLDGSRLSVGQHVTSGSTEVQVVHAGRATWTLAPNSRGMLAFGGELLTVQLERGSALAEVVPSQRKESFAIEADALRAAAHGTAFRVSRRGDHAEVEVTEGVVAVGPASTRGDTRGWLLTAPAKGHFTLDGESSNLAKAEAPAATGGVALAPRAQGPAPAAEPAPPDADASPDPVELPEKPTMDAVQSVFARLIPMVNQCFGEHTQARGDMQVSASTRLTLRVAPDGAITGRDFAPPLAPAVLACSAPRIDAMRFAPSKQGITVTRYIQLELGNK